MNKTVIVMRGLPGSGKSYYANGHSLTPAEAADRGNVTVLSADHFFYNSEGEYVFEPSNLGAAHAFCFREFIKALQANTADTIIIDNTNSSEIEIAPYMLGAAAFRRDARVVTVSCPVELCAQRNTHKVPLETIEKMALSMNKPLPPWWSHYQRTHNHTGDTGVQP